MVLRRRERGNLCASDDLSLLQCMSRDYTTSQIAGARHALHVGSEPLLQGSCSSPHSLSKIIKISIVRVLMYETLPGLAVSSHWGTAPSFVTAEHPRHPVSLRVI